MIENSEHHLSVEPDPEATIIAAVPLFSEQATESARPVVPLAEKDFLQGVRVVRRGEHHNASARDLPARSGAVVAAAGRRRTPLLVPLIFVAALVGSVVGGLGLRFYQRQRAATNASVRPVKPAAPETAQTIHDSEVTNDARQAATIQINATEPPTIIEEIEETPLPAWGIREPVVDESGRDNQTGAARPRRESSSEPRKAAAGHVKTGTRVSALAETREAESSEAATALRPRRVRTEEEDEEPHFSPDPDASASEEESPGPRRIDRLRDIMSGPPAPRREPRRDGQPTRTVDRVRGIFEGHPPR